MAKYRLKIDLDELCYAFEDHHNEYYLDLKTGELLFISSLADEEEVERIEDQLEREPNRYLWVPKLLPQEGYAYMQEFIETVGDPNLQEKLWIAIDGPGAFGRFRRVLSGYPEEQERWFKFKDERVREHVEFWLRSEGIEIQQKHSQI
jgi:hypothetical protein